MKTLSFFSHEHLFIVWIDESRLLEEYVRDTFTFDEDKALKAARNKLVKIITTDKITGKPHYLTPTKENG